ncbi:Uncharacterized protein EJ110_NYTH52419 [Nymphaea thermarum]|nr:Uncharacterized protein EJ110_NYTH52419 [Nymphaea thermarum]
MYRGSQAFKCGFDKAKCEASKPVSYDTRPVQCSEGGGISTWNGAASLGRRAYLSSAATSVSGSETGNCDVEFEEIEQDRDGSTVDTFSSSANDDLGYKRYSEISESGKYSDDVYEREDSLSEASSSVLDEHGKSKEELHWNGSGSSLGGNFSDNLSSSQLKGNKKGQSYQERWGTLGLNGAATGHDASGGQVDGRKREGSKVPTVKSCPHPGGSSSLSRGKDGANQVTERRQGQSRRTLFRPQYFTDRSREMVDENSRPTSPEIQSLESASRSENILEETEMASSQSKSEGSKSPSRIYMQLNHSQVTNQGAPTKPIHNLPLFQGNSRGYYNQMALKNDKPSRFQLMEPSVSRAGCTVDEIPSKPEEDTLEILRKVEELHSCLIKSHLPTGRPNSKVHMVSSGTQPCEADFSTTRGQVRSPIRTYNSDPRMQSLHHCPADSNLEDNMRTGRNHPGLHAQTRRPGTNSLHPNHASQKSRTHGLKGGSYMVNKLDFEPEIVQSQHPDYSTPCLFCSSLHCNPEDCQKRPQFPSYMCYNQGSCYQSPNSWVAVDSKLENICHEKRRYQENEVVIRKKAAACRPIFCGAPFFICHDCLKLLKLPSVFFLSKKRVNKVKCGNCSAVLRLSVSENGHIAPIPKHKSLTEEIDHRCGNTDAEKFVACKGQGSSEKVVEGMATSEDDFQSEPVTFSEEHRTSFSGSDHSSKCKPTSLTDPFPPLQQNASEKRGPPMNSPEWTEKASAPTSKELIDKYEHIRNDSGTNIRYENDNECGVSSSRSRAVSPLNARFGSPYHRLRRDHSESSESENADILSAAHSPEHGFKPINKESVSTLNKDPEPGQSSDFQWKSDEGQQSKNSSKNSTMSGLLKNIRDLNINFEGAKTKVFVNGNHIPDRLVKSAEEQAGPIQPGNYWYDYHAGFWGVIGGPCLGVILPYIQEFDVPMPKACSGGSTGVVVNGRELHRQDLDMLARKGLPREENREYFINISGQVTNKVTGERFSLGNLAPTVERRRRGFGMLVPLDIRE